MISTLSFSQWRDTFHLETGKPSRHVTIPGQKQPTCQRLPWPISVATSCSEPGGATINVSPRRACDFTAAKHQKLKSQICCKHEDGNQDLRDIMDYSGYAASQVQGHIDRLSPIYTNMDPVIRPVAFIRYYMQMFPAGRTCVNVAAGFNHSWRTTCINRTMSKLRLISLIFSRCCRYQKKSEQGLWLCRSGSSRRTLPNPTNICQRLD